MPQRRTAGDATMAVGYAAAYIGTAWLLASSAFPSGFTPWYPPAGLTLAYLLLARPGGAPVVVALGVRLLNTAVVFPDAWKDEPDAVVLRGLAITGCYAIAAAVLRKAALHDARLRELGWFVLVGVIGAPLVAALSVATVEVLMLDSSAADAFDAAFTFWVGDAVAVVAIVPAALLLAASLRGALPRAGLPRSRSGRLETAAQAAALILVPIVATTLSGNDGETAYLALTVIPAVWVASRRDLVLAASGLLVLTATLSTVAMLRLDDDVAVAELQAVLLATSLAGLYIAASNRTQDVALTALADSEARLRSVIDSAPDLVVRFDADGVVRFASDPPWLDDAGGTAAVVDDLRQRWGSAITSMGGDGAVRAIEWEHRADGGEVRTYGARLAPERRADGSLRGVVAVITDLTPQRRAEAQREEARRRDPLTGLTNRAALCDVLATLDPATVAQRLAIAVIDLDRFGTVNDALGHETGDEVLREAAERLLAASPDALVVARSGANEFTVALLVADDEPDLATLAQHLADAVATADRDRPSRHLTASAGAAMGGTNGTSALEILRDAETAMHAAKEAGRDRVTVFDADRRSHTAERRAAEQLLRRRLDERDILVHYHPVVDLRTGALQAVEALVRLCDERGEIMMPDRFIGVAEDTGLDVELGALVLEQVLAQLAAWPASTLVANVNVTARQLTRPGFAAEVVTACHAAGVAPERLCLELTETLVMTDPEAAISTLAELRVAGVSAVLDDFGTGYSSIAYLSRLPVTGLKIDKSFVDGLPGDEASRAVVGLVTGLGPALHLAVIAEGIERQDQAAALLRLGCSSGQGFLYGRPAGPEEIAQLLASRSVAAS